MALMLIVAEILSATKKAGAKRNLNLTKQSVKRAVTGDPVIFFTNCHTCA
jgi:hypothetical protein